MPPLDAAIDPVAAAIPVAHMIAVGLICTAIYKALKRGTPRPRSYQVHASIAAGALPLDRFSFPSGHTPRAVAFTLTAIAYYPLLIWPLAPFALLTGVSRTVLGPYYPSDALAVPRSSRPLRSIFGARNTTPSRKRMADQGNLPPMF